MLNDISKLIRRGLRVLLNEDLLLSGIVSLGILLLLPSAVSCAADPSVDSTTSRHIVVMYSGPLDFPATEMTEKGIRQVFSADSAFHVQLFSEYLDLSRFRDREQRNAYAELLRHRYRKGQIDLIICVDVPAAVFLLEYGETVLPGIPVVMCCIPDALSEKIDMSPIKNRTTGVFEPKDAEELVNSVLALLPATRCCVLISGAYENDRVRSIGLRKAIEAAGKRVRFIDLSGLSIEELLSQLKRLPDNSVIFFSTFFVDGRGRSFAPRDVLKMISDTVAVPIFGLYDSYLGYGIVGGKLVSMTLQGKIAAEKALRILNGKSMSGIPFDDGSGTSVIVYDWRQLKRWKIGEDNLPAGSTVRYKEATAWDLYRSYIIGVVTLIVFESMLIIALIINLQKRKKAEVALLNSRQDLKSLAGRLISAQEEELSRLSREFHDDLAQRIAAVAIESGTLEIQSGHIEPAVRHKMKHINAQLSGIAEDVHLISRQIHPSILKDLGLVRAIDSQCVRFSDMENIPIAFHHHDIPDCIPKEISLCIYRIIQESLRNIAKHSSAHHIEISLKYAGRRLQLQIGDDGIGFNPLCARLTPGIGIASMRERVQYVNGEFNIHSEPGKGTVIQVGVPLEKGKE